MCSIALTPLSNISEIIIIFTCTWCEQQGQLPIKPSVGSIFLSSSITIIKKNIIRERDLEKRLVLNLAKLDRKKCENMALKAKKLHSYDACAEVRKVCNTLLKWKIK